jgi:cytochrome c556
MKKVKWFIALIFLVVSPVLMPSLGLTQDVVEKRLKLMENNFDALKAIRAAEKEKDYSTLQVKAKEIVGNMGRVLDLFPKGSTSDKSFASPTIWDKWDEFGKSASKTKAAAEELVSAAAAKDDAKVKVQVKAIGGMTSGACGGCHLSFNTKRMKKAK